MEQILLACIRKKDEDFENKVNQLSKQYKNTIDIILLNLEHEKEIEKAFNEIKNLNVKIDILINNAGINQISLFQMTPLEKIRSVFQINFFSAVSFTQKKFLN